MYDETYDGKPSAEANKKLRPVGTDEPRAPKITEVYDRPLADHATLVKLSRASQAKGAKDAGLNEQTQLESLDDNGHAPEVRKNTVDGEPTGYKARRGRVIPTPSQFNPGILPE